MATAACALVHGSGDSCFVSFSMRLLGVKLVPVSSVLCLSKMLRFLRRKKERLVIQCLANRIIWNKFN